ncbi:MAG: HU family DNA-binding protein [Candidatus Marinimicrobia bacterium]|jgi:DNA-binding protein HU-beta|nr:HU family DNA-binding protein [Candidatus Neomarinimicrobiota bacterium]MBT3824534.1 HU family DNA-binding protein [Candidatus Neomarinimicrobiota bacterium]MBT4131330.1 HU family DNA-binding protein [Candidatus Neomarinimicrobiota bacterium]MBT4295100.1 HU family DNA-binding protein [Candidatus Neomarinimicrobiota bacterium]MBT4418941.1 HU family DNA-binding protein [Candidatus Neomarinimicrobiota bacterium]
MNKAELIAKIADDAGISKVQAEKALGAFTGAVTDSLKGGNKIALVGFGTFDVSARNARVARNPRTGEPINVPAMNVPRFKAGKGLKEAVN